MKNTTRRKFLQLVPAEAALSSLPATHAALADPGPLTLWYKQPAVKWEEALAIGNGRLGAMIFSGVEKERLQLNEITVWSGKLEKSADRKESYKQVPEIRKMIEEGKYVDAGKAMSTHMTITGVQAGRKNTSMKQKPDGTLDVELKKGTAYKLMFGLV